ncbi:Na+/H+ antiporter NhaC family protein [Peptacetobacter hiranonis]|uniref:Na+/H+ antiporter family protein n=1 Tax=Peptacetobacter hiranonis (strain DSM 13275 / JCM 10541 / KCTC 15199 / TO-931) TaxID=500633 RepID=B6FXL3_PEPHT|nr:Na+/H+ antiporter NhaC family protein [Peptacetobacter hiranonis]EEA85714.1 Na+/H+ antiporter family protein [Peptacetobacter hiranonis DSM 13275]QEK20652.1 Malate-2H(+)/Na(+)-lactate antiporter [Peptacetobacter hiranonis]
MDQNEKIKPSGKALIPFAVFILLYLGVGIILETSGTEMAFYQLPAPVAIIVGVVVAFIIFKGSIEEKFSQFAKGCGNENILIMCFIYLFAGAFATVAKSMGGVDSTVNLGLSFIPAQYITAGLFVIAAFISVATGTSMGTISTVAPIAIATAEKAGLNMTLIVAAIIGGAMFGDNLSVISDTTIAATRTQNCELKDKFKVNFYIALPAAILTFVLLIIFGKPETIVPIQKLDYNIVKVIPYILVLGLAVSGFNVFLTLGVGTVVAGIVGIAYGDLTPLTFAQNIYAGFTGMNEIFLLSMFTGGLAHMVTQHGGLQWILEKIQSVVKSEKSAQIGISAIAAAADMAVANNTVAIIITGPIAKELSRKYKVDPRKSASLLDIWTCIFQGFIPYGAQILLAGSLTAGAVSPLALFPFLWYQQLLAVFTLISMFIPYADGLIKKRPWNWELDKAEEITE